MNNNGIEICLLLNDDSYLTIYCTQFSIKNNKVTISYLDRENNYEEMVINMDLIKLLEVY